MSISAVRDYFNQFAMATRVLEFDCSSATVELAAQALNCEPARIAKSLSFHSPEHCILIVAAGDAKVNSGKFKTQFGMKASMLSPDAVTELVGHAVGGVCPFAIRETTDVYLDVSLQRFATVFPACGSANSAIELSCEELERYAQNCKGWVDVCKGWEAE